MPKDPQLKGIMPRAFESIFKMIQSDTESEYLVRVSYLEIYNEQMFDLLSDAPRDPSGGSNISI